MVLDAVGNLSIAAGRRLLSPKGVLLAVAGLGDTVRARGNVAAGSTPERVEDFEFLLQLAAEGAFTVVIDQIPSHTFESTKRRDASEDPSRVPV